MNATMNLKMRFLLGLGCLFFSVPAALAFECTPGSNKGCAKGDECQLLLDPIGQTYYACVPAISPNYQWIQAHASLLDPKQGDYLVRFGMFRPNGKFLPNLPKYQVLFRTKKQKEIIEAFMRLPKPLKVFQFAVYVGHARYNQPWSTVLIPFGFADVTAEVCDGDIQYLDHTARGTEIGGWQTIPEWPDPVPYFCPWRDSPIEVFYDGKLLWRNPLVYK